MIKRSIKIKGHSTSVTLEKEFWIALEALAAAHHTTVTAIIVEVDARRTRAEDHRSLSSHLRVWILEKAGDGVCMEEQES